MPIKCCVPLCRSNYDDETSYTTVFKFPSETRRPEMRQKWIQSIHRKEWAPSKRSVVCIKHFQKEDVINFDKFTDANGIEHTIKRHYPALKPDAYPTIFSRQPSSLKTLKTEPAAPHNHTNDSNKPASDKCCVPGCRSNYRRQGHTPVFQFPSDPNLNKKWLELIGGRNYVVNKDSFVCVKHFEPHFLITVSHVEQNDGTILLVPRTTPKLQSGALPTVFPHASPSSSAKLPRKRKRKAFEDDNNINKDEATGDLEINQQNCDINDSTASFHSLYKENDSHVHQQMSKSNPAVISTDEDTSRCVQMIRDGQLWTRNSAKHRSGFTEMCQNLDKKVQLPSSLVCGEHSSTVTTDIKVEIPSPPEHGQTSLALPDSASEGESVSTVSGTSDTSQSLAPGQARDTATTDIKVEKPHILRRLLTEHCQISRELPGSASGGESVSGTSDTSQSLAPGQARGKYYCPQCSTVFPHRSMLYKHFINAHTSGGSKKNHASADICAACNDKSVNKGGCHGGVAGDRNEENQKRPHSCTAEKSHKPDVCSTVCVNVGQLQTRKHEQRGGTSARRISVLTEVSSQKLIQENNDMLTVDKLHSENGNSNEPLQERISANEIISEVCVRNKCHTVCGQKTFCIRTVKKTYKCEFCDAQFSQFSLLKTHTIKHTGVKPFQCDVCGFGFTFKCFMDVHMRKHTGEKPYVCEYCGVRFANRRQLKLHTTSHTGEKPYKCDVCMLGFNHAFSLQAHMVKHTGVKPFHCEVCGVGFTLKSPLRIHMRKHTGEKPYACEDCGARFVNRRQLKVHRISHTGEKPYKCDICGSGFNQAFNLKLHKRKHTGEEPYKYGKGYKPYVCEICGLNFSFNSALQYHKRRHTGEKPHKCDVCDVAFAVKTSLINHKRKHTGEKPYSCDVCGLRFSVIESFQNHRRKHTGEKPYLCDICGTKFAFRGSLRDHKRLHTGEKPFKCGLCGADFSNRKKLQRHQKIHAE